YLGICDGNMEEGSLRCDANVSVRIRGARTLGTKTELKNLNSFRFVEKALEFEINRQIGVLESGGHIIQETLLWNPDEGIAVPMRSKEEAHDYRYFPEPDLVPVVVNPEQVEKIRASLPEFPLARRNRYVHEYGLPKYDANILTESKELADYFESMVRALKQANSETFKMASNWTMTEVLRVLNEKHLSVKDFSVSPQRLAGMIDLIVDGTISSKIAKEVFEEMLVSEESPDEIVRRKGLVQVSDTAAIERAVSEVLAKNPEQVQKYRSGKQQVFGYFVGETMKAMKGKANPRLVNEILKKKLEG
ncbi:MAG: Asp-tRNA(Asn)/Glu-tRNA(Gln) amidotransferase subunit GatB, partial [Ignavibacteriales bacterium]|nr:Asp-tRNA(Asn)/Glu-tRNA(Gln) amidotransferase subunit GatB [Ignavibacteriales bacterium]